MVVFRRFSRVNFEGTGIWPAIRGKSLRRYRLGSVFRDFEHSTDYNPQVSLTPVLVVHKISNVFCNGSRKELTSHNPRHYAASPWKLLPDLEKFHRNRSCLAFNGETSSRYGARLCLLSNRLAVLAVVSIFNILLLFFSLSRVVDIIVEKILGRIMTEIKIKVRTQKTSRAINARNRRGEINTLTTTVVIDDSRFTIFFRIIKIR